MFFNQGTSQPEASQEEEVNGDMASEWEELVELDDVQLATVVGGHNHNGNGGNDDDEEFVTIIRWRKINHDSIEFG